MITETTLRCEARAAFPYVMHDGGGESGMLLRDWFAGQALAGMHVMSLEGWTNKDIGLQAYSLADAMLSARDAAHSS